MSKCLIISRFKEDTSWLKNYKDFKIYIYNKGLKIEDNDFKNIINLENVGRESHTWVHHIINNYDNLSDINIFLQGRIDDLGCMAFMNPNEYIKHINKYGFVASRYGILGPNHWDWNIGIENDPKYKKAWEKNEISRSEIGFRKFSKNLFPGIPKFVTTSYGGCFAVKKDLIRSYDISFYKKLISLLNKSKNPIEGHYMERLWCYMYTKNAPFLESIFDVIYTKFERSRFKNVYRFLKTFKDY